jgi:CheY-like chemotaxis protein
MTGSNVAPRGKVLVVDDDNDIATMVQLVLADEGFGVTILADHTSEAIRAAVESVEPDCILLDGEGNAGYGQSWLEAARLTGRPHPVPLIMFTASTEAIAEAQANESERSHAANFAGVLSKPFSLDDLVAQVMRAVGDSRLHE